MAKPQNHLITNKSNIAYLSNFTGSNGFMLVTAKKKYLFTDSRYILRAKNTIKRGIEIVDITRMWRNREELEKSWGGIFKKHRIKTLGVDESDLTVERYNRFKKITPKVKFTNIAGHYEAIREIKTRQEIKLLQKSQDINGKVFEEIAKFLQSFRFNRSLTEIEVAWKIRELGFQYGAEDISFEPIVGFGKNSAIVHHAPTKTKLKKADVILIDMGMKYQGYCSDMSRTILPKKPKALEQEIYNTVLNTQIAGCEFVKAGVTGHAADKVSRDIIEAAGYGDYYSHAGGHGIGLDVHEQPALSAGYKAKLLENSVVTVEPGIYLPGKFGVRIEDMVLVTKKGHKNLTKVRK